VDTANAGVDGPTLLRLEARSEHDYIRSLGTWAMGIPAGRGVNVEHSDRPVVVFTANAGCGITSPLA